MLSDELKLEIRILYGVQIWVESNRCIKQVAWFYLKGIV